MRRNNIIKLLQKYVASEAEIACKKKMLEFIQSHENCFDRSLKIGHMTASAWLVNESNSKALLMHHAKLGQWFQLGGHCDGDSDLLAVALKEASEESGITQIHAISKEIFDIDIHLIPKNKKEQAHYHYDVRFLLQSSNNEICISNRESKELRWVGKEEILPTSNPSVIRMFTKWISKPM
ncbi:MAG: NUDIX hydrolase [Candidatus Rhabdochlamydia sp.]